MLNNVITLQFHSILDLVDFHLETDVVKYEINRTNFTLRGSFSEADVELATAGFEGLALDQ